jgi:DNA-binding response OmpR family regulator
MAAKILIVDDDQATRLGLTELLEAEGHSVTAVATLHEGLEVVRSGAPDLLIADVRLGAFNGLQLLMANLHSLPAIMISGFADPVLEAEARKAGAEYMVKPIDPARLLILVEQKVAGARPEHRPPF